MRFLRDMTEPELREYFNLLAAAIEETLPGGSSKKGRALFVLLVFDEPGLAQYVSNAERQDIIKAMRETADRLEAKQDIPR
jgi:hypothetical protein